MQITRSASYALKGINYCFRSEINFRIEIMLSAIALTLCLAFNVSSEEWIIILVCIMMVLALEIINTAIEKLSDALCMTFHPLIKATKDLAAGAVLLTSVISLIIGCIIFIPKIFVFIKFILQ